MQRTAAELDDAARRAAYHDPGVREVQGALAALDWLRGRCPGGPIGRRKLASRHDLLSEANDAAMTGEGIIGTDRGYGKGAESILFWAAGMQPLPGWLRATS